MKTSKLSHAVTRMGRRRLAVALVVVLSAPAAAGAQQAIDTERSTITVHAYKSGLFRAFADDHDIQAPIADGSFDSGTNARVEVVVDAARMRVLDPRLSQKDRDQVQTRMVGPEVLDVTRFPQIRFESTGVDRADGGWMVRGQLTLHGQTRPVTVKVADQEGHYKGSASLKQTDFGIVPVSVAGGTVKVKDELKIDFDIVAGQR